MCVNPPCPHLQIQFVNYYDAYDRTPVLMAMNNGRYASVLDGMTEHAVLEEAMAALRWMFGADTPWPRQWVMSNWTYEPHTLHAYSYWRAGIDPGQAAKAAAPRKGTLFFAGEWAQVVSRAPPGDAGRHRGAGARDGARTGKRCVRPWRARRRMRDTRTARCTLGGAPQRSC